MVLHGFVQARTTIIGTQTEAIRMNPSEQASAEPCPPGSFTSAAIARPRAECALREVAGFDAPFLDAKSVVRVVTIC